MANIPGIGSSKQTAFRNLFLNDFGKVYSPGAHFVDADKSNDPDNTGTLTVLRDGLVLGKDSNTNLFRTAILGVTATDYTSGTTLAVTSQCAAEISRLYGTSGSGEFYICGVDDIYQSTLTVAPVSHSGISGGNITITALDEDYEAGAFIIAGEVVEQDEYTGAYQIRSCRLLAGDGYGVQVAPNFGGTVTLNGTAYVDQCLPHGMLVGGQINTASIVNYPTLAALKRWLKDQLRREAIGFVFSDEL